MSDHVIRHVVVISALPSLTNSERASETAVEREDKEDENEEEEADDVVEKGVNDLEDNVLGGVVAHDPPECRLAIRTSIVGSGVVEVGVLELEVEIEVLVDVGVVKLVRNGVVELSERGGGHVRTPRMLYMASSTE